MDNKHCGMNHYHMTRVNRSGQCPGNRRSSIGSPATAVPAAAVECTPDGQPMALAMAYVPIQMLNTIYEPQEGFCQGTIFPELNKPWMVGGVNCG